MKEWSGVRWIVMDSVGTLIDICKTKRSALDTWGLMSRFTIERCRVTVEPIAPKGKEKKR